MSDARGKRTALPNAEILIRQVSGEYGIIDDVIVRRAAAAAAAG